MVQWLTPNSFSFIIEYIKSNDGSNSLILQSEGKSPEIIQDLKQCHWAGASHGRWTTETFSRILKECFTDGGSAKLGLAAWHQVTVSITRAHLSSRLSSGSTQVQ